MSVFTTVTDSEMCEFLEEYNIGKFISLEGIPAGVTNTNYFLNVEKGRYILTIFETLTEEELPFFLDLTFFLNQRGVACPYPLALTSGEFAGYLKDKPAAIISLLDGEEVQNPNDIQCYHVGQMLAKMHVEGAHFPEHMENPRFQEWWTKTALKLESEMPSDVFKLLMDEIEYLNYYLPETEQGIIHADLFKDNVLMNKYEVAGFIDFYYACNGPFMYDYSIAVNDWARDPKTNKMNEDLESAFREGYLSRRKFSKLEIDNENLFRRAACVRFWVSRLLDYHFVPEGDMVLTKDPNVFKDLLIQFR